MVILLKSIAKKKGGQKNSIMVKDQVSLTNENKHSMQQTSGRTQRQRQEQEAAR
jgi:hypothetical protein